MHTIAIIGLGQGLSHLQAFQMLPDCRVVAVCDVDAQLAAQTAQQYEVPTVYTDIEAVLADRSVDAVVIATPDHLHGQHAIMALTAGKHVLSEIPMALNTGSCIARGPNWSAGRTPCHGRTACGAHQRRSPTGGAANGIPLKQ